MFELQRRSFHGVVEEIDHNVEDEILINEIPRLLSSSLGFSSCVYFVVPLVCSFN